MTYDTIVDELFWYFVHSEADCEVPFLLGSLNLAGHTLDIPDDTFRPDVITRARRIRNTLRAVPERWQRVLSRAFEPRAFRHAWQRVGKAHQTELASLAVSTLAFRLRFDDTSNDGDHPQRYRVMDKWVDPDGLGHAEPASLDGLEAYLLSLEKSKVVRRASRTAARMLCIALEHYRRARGSSGGGKRLVGPRRAAA